MSSESPVSSSPTLLEQDYPDTFKAHEDEHHIRKHEYYRDPSLSSTRSRSYHDGFSQHHYRRQQHHPYRTDSGGGAAIGINMNRRRSLSPGEEESVMIAVRALDDMRSRGGRERERGRDSGVYDGQAQAQTQTQIHQAQVQYSPSSMTIASSQPTPALSVSSNSAATSPSLASAYLPEIVAATSASQDFVSRVSGIPLVNSAIRAYEHTKASSRVVKYGAEMMESSMKSISKPVINRLPVSELDEFACRQLDRLESYGRPGWTSRGRSRSQERIRSSSETERMSISGDRSESPRAGPSSSAVSAPNEEAINRSRWHSLLYEAGGIGAAVSDESMRRLQYCLQWLQYATQHLDGQIVVLRDFIGSLPPMRQENEGPNAEEEELIPPAHLRTLADVRQNVVNITRQVVSVVSKYAGGTLPEPARSHVRQFVLTLPERWANANTAQREAEAHRSEESRASSSSSMLPTPAVASPSSSRNVPRPTTVAATQAAERILTLATESLDMMRGITGIFRESLDRADTWIERLRAVGIQRRQPEEYRFAIDIARENQLELPPIQSFDSYPQQSPAPADTTIYDAPSPQALTASSLSALTLSSTYNTPKTSTTSLPDVGWSYNERDSLRTIGPGLSAVRGTVDHFPTSMDMDE